MHISIGGFTREAEESEESQRITYRRGGGGAIVDGGVCLAHCVWWVGDNWGGGKLKVKSEVQDLDKDRESIFLNGGVTSTIATENRGRVDESDGR